MMQFLNNVWIALSTENATLMNLIALPSSILELYLITKIFIVMFKIPATFKQNITYVGIVSLLSILIGNLIPRTI